MAFAAAESAAAGPTVFLYPAGDTIELRGRVGDAGVSRTIRLSADADVKGLAVLTDDIRDAAGIAVDEASLDVTAPNVIQKNSIATVVLKAVGLKRPGSYDTTIRFLPTGRTTDDATTIDISITVYADPQLTPTERSKTLRLRLAHCGHGSCRFGHLILGGGPFNPERTLLFTRPPNTRVDVTQISVDASGTQGRQLTPGDLFERSDWSFPVGGDVSLPLRVDTAGLPADTYSGDIRITIADRDEPIVVPIDLTVKDGPVGAVLAILAGLILGRVFDWWQKHGVPRSAADRTLRQLRRRAQQELGPADRDAIVWMFTRIESAIDQHDFARAGTEATLVSGRLDTLAEIGRISADIPAGHDDLALLLHRARIEVRRGDDAGAKVTVATVLEALRGKPATDLAVQAGEELIDAIVRLQACWADDEAAPRITTGRRGWGALRAVAWLAGVSGDVVRAAASRWSILLRSIFALIAFALIGYTGLKTLYIQNADAFGSNGIADYAVLLVWGLSADIASRALGNLPAGLSRPSS